MKRICLTLAAATIAALAGAQSINRSQLDQIRDSYGHSDADKAAQNAVSNNYNLKSLALNRDLQGKTDHLFTHRVTVSGITDQQQSGRCWMFTSMNVLRPGVMEKYNLSSFDFSHNYCYFWDMFEKSNLFLENVIRTAGKDILLDRDVDFFFRSPVNDGGVWNSFYNIASKYGVVPAEVMPETAHSNRTSMLTAFLNELLRKEGYALREAIAAGASASKARTQKTEALKKVYRLLATCLGEPPTAFEWRYKTRDGEIRTLSTTPTEFYKTVIPEGYGPDSYIMVMHDPTREFYKVYEIENYRNTYEGTNWKYLNLPLPEIKAAAIASIKNNEALYASCDVSDYYNRDSGYADPTMYDYEALLRVDFEITDKKARILTRESGSAHAMALIAVDLDENGSPVKWQFENSWGPDSGHKGYFTFTDKWFDDYMFRIVIGRDYLNAEALKAARTKPVVLPAWDYMF